MTVHLLFQNYEYKYKTVVNVKKIIMGSTLDNTRRIKKAANCKQSGCH
jgi:hypothetical protein